MAIRTSSATWEGDLPSGKGTINVGENAYEGAYSFASRFEEGEGTNPEELIAAALAGCYAMALAHGLAQDGHTPRRVQATATAHLSKDPAGGFHIPKIDLRVEAEVPDLDADTFQRHAEDTKKNCPVSKALSTEITLQASLAD
ncbi:MAG: OsmC family peroxiredoxin [Rhodothermales bacterium]|nr:OsmC family peroxiredoxin [Rhodothermales bacterium]